MRFYLGLQCKRMVRMIRAFGIPPLIGVPLIAILFLGISYCLFTFISFPQYIFLLLTLSQIGVLAAKEKNQFLESIFSKGDYYKIRLSENLMLCLPFFAVLVFYKYFLIAIALLVLAASMAFVKSPKLFQFSMPSPFARYPFEFTRGFRTSIVTILIAYALSIIAAIVGNFFMGAFSLILLILCCINFYIKPEAEYFVWIHSRTAASFLFHKIKIALLYGTLICLPVIIFNGIIFSYNLHILLIIFFIGLALTVLSLLSKYSNYPSDINFPQTMALLISVWFPPLLLAFIPFFYFRSVNRLKEILK